MARRSFPGATRTITGSMFLVEHNGFRLLVDREIHVPEYREKVEV